MYILNSELSFYCLYLNYLLHCYRQLYLSPEPPERAYGLPALAVPQLGRDFIYQRTELPGRLPFNVSLGALQCVRTLWHALSNSRQASHSLYPRLFRSRISLCQGQQGRSSFYGSFPSTARPVPSHLFFNGTVGMSRCPYGQFPSIPDLDKEGQF